MGNPSMRLTMPNDDCETRVNKVSQGDLFEDGSRQGRWRRFLRILAEGIDEIGTKRLAGELDEKPSVISNALAERDRHYFKTEWLLCVLELAPSTDILAALADAQDCDIVPREEIPPEERERRRKEAILRRFGPDGAAAIERDVRRR